MSKNASFVVLALSQEILESASAVRDVMQHTSIRYAR